MTVFDLGKISGSDAKDQTAKYIAGEIKRLLNSGIRINYKNEERYLSEKDICILIRKAAEAIEIENELTENEIPHSFYKKSGLYNTVEAKSIYFLFNALANPDDSQAFYKSLLTDFFGLKVSELENIRLDPDSEINRIFNKWCYLSETRDYRRLFRSIITDSGLIYRELDRNDGERKITNMEQILQNLEKRATDENLDMTLVANLLKNLIKNEIAAEENETLQKRETEDDRVQIMTIHASKGLEFPVVFMAGGFTRSNKSDFYKYHDKGDIVYDLNRKTCNKQKNDVEEDEEEKRLYYVAFTRAIFYLYIPYLEPLNRGSSGFTATFIKEKIQNSILNITHPEIITADPFSQKETAADETRHIYEMAQGEKLLIPETLLPSIDRALSYRITSVKSFSGIKRNISNNESANIKENDEMQDSLNAIKDDDLPGGNMTGNMFHGILEKINYNNFSGYDNPGDIMDDRKISGIVSEHFNFFVEKKLSADEKRKSQAYLGRACEILFNTMKVPIDDNGLRLCDTEKSGRLTEPEFYFALPGIKDTVIGEFHFKDGFLKGFIDLVFRHDGKYYIVDWKSNRYPEFSGEGFSERVRSDYELQYKIYTVAVLKWLKKKIEDFDYQKHFGGIYYLYLRARNFDNPDNGVYFFREESDPEIMYEEEISRILKK